MKLSPLERAAFGLYDLGWRLALPFLKKNSRLAEGFDQRCNGPEATGGIDLWIQAASAGESYLALNILEKISSPEPLKILITTNTRQGFDILNAAAKQTHLCRNNIRIAYFPFDHPSKMAAMVKQMRPRLTVLLETEIWPGLLLALKQFNLPAMILNGRLSSKSLNRYQLFPRLFQSVAPQKIAAISQADARRYRNLFTATPVTVMSNIKFDRINFDSAANFRENPLERFLGEDRDLVVLGSIRAEEEIVVEKIIAQLVERLPQIRIALFPRHMHRLEAWQTILNRIDRPWVRRSDISRMVSEGTIILWDTFGELAAAYALAKAVFVGGSLARLGGQNFLEPLAYGVRPVIGPYWDNFFWIENEIFSLKLAQRCIDWQSVTTALIETYQSPSDSEAVKAQALAYIRNRQGGTRQACAIIEESMARF